MTPFISDLTALMDLDDKRDALISRIVCSPEIEPDDIPDLIEYFQSIKRRCDLSELMLRVSGGDN